MIRPRSRHGVPDRVRPQNTVQACGRNSRHPGRAPSPQRTSRRRAHSSTSAVKACAAPGPVEQVDQVIARRAAPGRRGGLRAARHRAPPSLRAGPGGPVPDRESQGRGGHARRGANCIPRSPGSTGPGPGERDLHGLLGRQAGGRLRMPGIAASAGSSRASASLGDFSGCPSRDLLVSGAGCRVPDPRAPPHGLGAFGDGLVRSEPRPGQHAVTARPPALCAPGSLGRRAALPAARRVRALYRLSSRPGPTSPRRVIPGRPLACARTARG